MQNLAQTEDILNLLLELEQMDDKPFPQHVVDVLSKYFHESLILFSPGPAYELLIAKNDGRKFSKQKQYFIPAIANVEIPDIKQLNEYNHHLFRTDPKQPANIPQEFRGKSTLRFSDIWSEEDFKRSDMYAYLRKVGLLNNVTIYLHDGDDYLAGIIFLRSTELDDYSDKEIKLLEVVSKFITPLYISYIKNIYNKSIAEIYRNHYDSEQVGLAIVSPELEIVDANNTIHRYCEWIIQALGDEDKNSLPHFLELCPVKKVLGIIKTHAASLSNGFEHTFFTQDADYHCTFKPSVMVPFLSEMQALYVFSINKKMLLSSHAKSAIELTANEYGLTKQEKAILSLVANGHNTKQISESLFISPNTAKNHLSNIYRKLGIRNRIELFKMLMKE